MYSLRSGKSYTKQTAIEFPCRKRRQGTKIKEQGQTEDENACTYSPPKRTKGRLKQISPTYLSFTPHLFCWQVCRELKAVPKLPPRREPSPLNEQQTVGPLLGNTTQPLTRKLKLQKSWERRMSTVLPRQRRHQLLNVGEDY